MTVTGEGKSEFLVKLATHDSELKLIQDKMSSYEATLVSVLKKLEEFSGLLADINARPSFNLPNILANVKDVFLICGLIVAGIVYVAGNFYDSKLAIIAERQETNRVSTEIEVSRLKNVIDTLSKSVRTKEDHEDWCQANKQINPSFFCDKG